MNIGDLPTLAYSRSLEIGSRFFLPCEGGAAGEKMLMKKNRPFVPTCAAGTANDLSPMMRL